MSEKKSSGGIGFTGLLQIAFIVLKLCKVITWSWLWVLSPLWISAIIVAVLSVIIVFLKVRKEKRESEEWHEHFREYVEKRFGGDE